MRTYLETHVEVDKEWLLTNGIGGYASTALDGGLTRKYHAWLVASLPPPLGRVNMCSYIEDSAKFPDNSELFFSSQELLDRTHNHQFPCKKVELRMGLPFWTYVHNDYIIERSAFFIYQQNTLVVTYHLIQGPTSLELSFRPFFHFKHYEAPVNVPLVDFHCKIFDGGCEISPSNYPPVQLIGKSKWNIEERELKNAIYRIESERGYDSIGDLKSLGCFSEKLEVGSQASFLISTEPLQLLNSFSLEEAKKAENERRNSLLLNTLNTNPAIKNQESILNLSLAADQFIIISPRQPDITWTHATGMGEAHTIIAGYHWFTDWGRDTMISLEGLALLTGRHQEAKEILHLFAHHVKDGLIPNMFPDGQNEGVYYTADATLWFIHALKRYNDYTNDEALIKILLPKIQEIIKAHLEGTRFGIHMDPKDGLLIQGEESYALTWMDAKVGDLVVTPRRGKAVEINALWYNALQIIIGWFEKFHLKKKQTP